MNREYMSLPQRMRNLVFSMLRSYSGLSLIRWPYTGCGHRGVGVETGPGGGGDDRSGSAYRRRLSAIWFGRVDHQRAVVELHFDDAIVRQQVAWRLVTGYVWCLLEILKIYKVYPYTNAGQLGTR